MSKTSKIEDSSLIGLINKNAKGESFAVWKYYDKNNITVLFEDNTPKEGVTLEQFKAGNVFKPDIKNNYVGQTIINEVFDEYMIVEQKDSTVTLQNIESDVLVYNVPIDDALKGFFREDDDEDFSSFPVSPSKRGIIAEQERTLRNIIALLDKHKRAYVVRPTGFGKSTKLWPGLVNSGRYRSCLYVAITTDAAAKAKIKPHIKRVKVDTITYTSLRSYSRKEIAKRMNYDLVFFDEAYCIGGSGDEDNGQGAIQTFTAVKNMMELFSETDFVGATAIDYRMDGINVAFRMFNNHYCYPYSFSDAIRDGYIIPPRYLVGFNNIVELKTIGKEKIKESILCSREEALKRFSEFPFDEIDSNYMPMHITTACNALFPGTNYLRFLVFYLTNEDISENRAKIIDWFQKAYPDFEVNILIATSKARHKSCQEAIDALTTTPSDPEKYKGKIDLIFTCEKLAAEYHSNQLNGLILDRKTLSLQKYTQMIGRVVSCTNDSPVVIFDIWDNIHADFKNLFPSSITDEVKNAATETFEIDIRKLENPDFETLVKNRRGTKDLSKTSGPRNRGHKGSKPKTSPAKKEYNPMPEGQMDIKDYVKAMKEYEREKAAMSVNPSSDPDVNPAEEKILPKDDISKSGHADSSFSDIGADDIDKYEDYDKPECDFDSEHPHYDDDSQDFGRKGVDKSKEEPLKADEVYENDRISDDAEDVNIIVGEEELGYQYTRYFGNSYSSNSLFKPLNLAMKEMRNPLDIIQEITTERYQKNICQIIESYKAWFDIHKETGIEYRIYSSKEEYLADKEAKSLRIFILKKMSEEGFRGGIEETDEYGKKTWLNIPVDEVVQYMIKNYNVA